MPPRNSKHAQEIGPQPRPGSAAALITDEDLAGQALFDGVDFATIRPLLACCPVIILGKDEVLIGAGRPNQNVYLVLSGRLSVRLASAETAPITEIVAGDSVGELSVIDGQPTSAYVVAETESRMLAVDEQLLWILVQSSHAISSNLLFTLTKRLRYGNQIIFKDRERHEQFRFHATVDAVTGLFNRHWLNAMLPRQMHRSRICDEPFSLLMVDIDHFKSYNDQHGHVAGDRAIGAVTKSMRDCLRPTDMAARYGGEEFLVLLPNCPLQAAVSVAERVRSSVANTNVTLSHGQDLPSVTVSVGIAQMSDTDTLESFVAAADAALYRAKQDGRDRVSR